MTLDRMSRSTVGSLLTASGLGLLASLAVPIAAAAHPHIWVTTRAEVVVEAGAIVAIRHHWMFDEYYSTTAIDGLDTNKDGIYSREELAELAKVNVEALKDFDYFTYPRLAGQDLPVAAPKDYWLEHVPKPAAPVEPDQESKAAPSSGTAAVAAAADKPTKVLQLHFTLPLAKPVLAEASGFTFGVGDPTYFIAFEPAADDPVKLAPGAPKGCKVAAVAEKKPDAPANPSKPGDLMATQPAPGDLPIVKFVAATEWEVKCGPPS